MSRANQDPTASLTRLINLCYDSARGFLIAAQSVSNRGLKALFRGYSHQRFKFVADLQEEVRHQEHSPGEAGSYLGGVHRGWIVIKSAMSVGPQSTEDVVFREIVRGESYALEQYDRVLKEELPDEVRDLIGQQRQQIEAIRELGKRMAGLGGKRLVVRLYDRHEDAEWTRQELEQAGYDPATMHTIAFSDIIAENEELAEEDEVTADTVSAGALMGLGLGLVLGVLAGIGILFFPELGPGTASGLPGILLISIAGGVVAGTFIGAFFGALIGRGVSQKDIYLYAESVRHGQTLLMLEAEDAEAQRAARLMRQVDVSTAVT